MSGRTAVLFALHDGPSLVVRAEELGCESTWATEGQGKTAFGEFECQAAHTEEIGLTTGIVNVFSRTPTALAMATATLDNHSGGHVIPGLGVAHPGVVRVLHGVPFDRSLSRFHGYVELVRRYLRDNADSFDGELFSPERMSFWDASDPVHEEIPIYSGALSPANIRLTGQVVDGWLPNLYPRPQFETALEWLDIEAARTGYDPGDVDMVMYVLTVVHDGPDETRRATAEHVACYLRDVSGYYDRAAEQAGFVDEVEAIRAVPTIKTGARELSAGFLDLVALVGTPDDVQGQLVELRRMGVDLPVVRVPAGVDREWVVRMLEVFAP